MSERYFDDLVNDFHCQPDYESEEYFNKNKIIA